MTVLHTSQRVSWRFVRCLERQQKTTSRQNTDVWFVRALCRDCVSTTSGTPVWFSCFMSWLNHNVWSRSWQRSALQAFSSAVDRRRCRWRDLCRLRQGTSPFVVRTPLNIFHRNNYHTICSFLPACCSPSACQLLSSPTFSLTSSQQGWWGASEVTGN